VFYNYVHVRTGNEERKGKELEELRYTATIRGGRRMGNSGSKETTRHPRGNSRCRVSYPIWAHFDTSLQYPSQLDSRL